MSRKPVGSRSVNASSIRVRKDRIASSHSRTLRCHSASPSDAAWRFPCTTTLRQRKNPSISSTSKATGQASLKFRLVSSSRVPGAVRPHNEVPAKT